MNWNFVEAGASSLTIDFLWRYVGEEWWVNGKPRRVEKHWKDLDLIWNNVTQNPDGIHSS